MDPSAAASLSSSSTRPDTVSGMAQSISSATISSSTTVTSAAILTCSLVSSSASPTSSLTSSRASTSAAAVPTTVITSVRSAILPFPYYNSANSEQQSKENPNLVSLLSGNSDSMSGDSPPPPLPPPTNKPLSSGVSQNTTLQSILLAKDPEYIPSMHPRANSVDNVNNNNRVPLPSPAQQHHFPLSEKCHSFLVSAGFQPNTFMPACPQQQQQPVAKSNHGNCMIYKGYKKLCNAQSLFKCNKSSTPNCPTPRAPAESQPQFQPNHPFGASPPAQMEHRQSAMSVSSPTSPTSSASGTCILGDLLRRGNKSRNKNYTTSDTSSLMDTAAAGDSNDRLSLASQNGASITAGVLAASMADDIMEQPVPPPGSAANSNNNNFSVSYYSQLLKRRIRKLYHDSDSIAGTDSQVYLQQQHQQQQQQQQQQQMLNESAYLPRARSASDATKYTGMVPSNYNRKSVISKLDAIPPNHFQQARAMFCNQMAELAGYKSPFCQPSSSNAVGPAGPSTTSSHQSVNSYLDTIIRSNVSRDQTVAAQSSSSSSTMPTSSGSVVSNSVITTVADINPNKPQHFVNLIDKIISNVFIGTTTTAAVVTGANSGASTSTTTCFMSPTSSVSSPAATPQSCSSLMSVLSSPEQLDAPSPSPSPMSPGPPIVAPLGPPPTPPSRPPSRPPSTVSAITQLLNSDGSPPASPPSASQPASPCQSHSDYPSTRPSPHPSPKPPTASNPMECINDISDKVYQQLIEFEFNHESILKKFQTIPGTDSHIIQSSRPGLNPNEKARIEELEKVLYPLQFCLSSMCQQREEMKRNLQKSFFQKNSGVSVDFQRQTLLATTEQAINLLIELTKQLDSFSELSSADQMNLLRTSVMEIMLMRSILILPQRFKEKMNSLKRCLEENGGHSSNGTGPCGPNHDNCSAGKLLSAIYQGKNKDEPSSSSTTENGGGENEPASKKDDLEPCTSHPHDRPFVDLASLDHRRLEDLMNSDEIGSESSRDSFADDSSSAFSGSGDIQAADYAKQFRAHYIKLARSIDKDWYEDKTIFYLLFAILLFRPTKSNIGDVEKVREEHLTYVYLLKRYLENKFKSYCTARSHFIRIFDRLEELQKMNDQVIQKLLDFDLVCAQNLLEKLCIC